MRKNRLVLFLSAAVCALFPAVWSEAQSPHRTAVFAGGNYWYLESAFDRVPGVLKARTGYTGGLGENPSYHEVTNGGSGHKMAVEVVYDPKAVSYEELLDVYWHSIDPTDQGGQFCHRGDQYHSVIYYASEEEKRAAEKSLVGVADEIEKNGIATRISGRKEFYPAEEYHQDYHQKESYKYRFHRKRCRMDDKLTEIWGSDALVEDEE